MMTLDEMLALLADNTTGDISAADLRSVVTDLYYAAMSEWSSRPYKWTNNSPPGSGSVALVGGWGTSATVLQVSETDSDGATVAWGLFDDATGRRVLITTADGKRFFAEVAGPSVDQGTYREIPLSADIKVAGTAPNNNATVTVTIAAVLGVPVTS